MSPGRGGRAEEVRPDAVQRVGQGCGERPERPVRAQHRGDRARQFVRHLRSRRRPWPGPRPAGQDSDRPSMSAGGNPQVGRVGQVRLQAGVPELVDRADLAQHPRRHASSRNAATDQGSRRSAAARTGRSTSHWPHAVRLAPIASPTTAPSTRSRRDPERIDWPGQRPSQQQVASPSTSAQPEELDHHGRPVGAQQAGRADGGLDVDRGFERRPSAPSRGRSAAPRPAPVANPAEEPEPDQAASGCARPRSPSPRTSPTRTPPPTPDQEPGPEPRPQLPCPAAGPQTGHAGRLERRAAEAEPGTVRRARAPARSPSRPPAAITSASPCARSGEPSAATSAAADAARRPARHTSPTTSMARRSGASRCPAATRPDRAVPSRSRCRAR